MGYLDRFPNLLFQLLQQTALTEVKKSTVLIYEEDVRVSWCENLGPVFKKEA